jgi:uncharacterized protein (DUF2236 family)
MKAAAAVLPGRLARSLRTYMEPDPDQPVDFTAPAGEPALTAPDSVSWQVFKNPIALFVGGVTAVLLELAEPRVRTGVWEHTTFRSDPIPRMRRTGLAAMVTVYGPRSTAEAMIAGIGRRHARVTGTTPAGEAYAACDPELLDWVQATASFGFLEAYHAYVRSLSAAEKDRFYAEGRPAAQLYGATGAPASASDLAAQFEAMRPRLECSDIVFEFLDIVARAPILPTPLRPFQRALIRAAVAIVPDWTADTLELGSEWQLGVWEDSLVRLAGRAAERIVVREGPAAQACRRMGLPANYLYAPR